MEGENHEKFLRLVRPAVPQADGDGGEVPQYDSLEQDAKIVQLERAVKNLTEILLVLATIPVDGQVAEVLLEMSQQGIDFEDDLKFT